MTIVSRDIKRARRILANPPDTGELKRRAHRAHRRWARQLVACGREDRLASPPATVRLTGWDIA